MSDQQWTVITSSLCCIVQLYIGLQITRTGWCTIACPHTMPLLTAQSCQGSRSIPFRNAIALQVQSATTASSPSSPSQTAQSPTASNAAKYQKSALFRPSTWAQLQVYEILFPAQSASANAFAYWTATGNKGQPPCLIYKSSLMQEQLLLLKPDHAQVIDWLYGQHVVGQECKDFISLFTARRDTSKSFLPQEQQVQCGDMQHNVCMLCRTLSTRT